MSKVISFSLWGNDPKYLQGAVANTKLALEHYPDWQCWLYCGSSVPDIFYGHFPVEYYEDFEDYTVYYAERYRLILLDEPGDWRSMFWRFEAILNPEVDVMISRDCDSRLSAREATAVEEWLESDKGFHAMIDHPHHSVPMLGGMWGMKQGVMPEFGDFMHTWNKEDRWQTDQDFLSQMIWPRAGVDMLRHDDGYFTHLWGGKPFPVARHGKQFVGASYDAEGNIDPDQVSLL